MNPDLATALAQLRDIHMPPAPGWWPPAPGWWVLGLIVSGLLMWLFRYAVRIYKRRQPYRQFQSEINAISLQPQTVTEDLQTMSKLVRRLAVTLCGRERVASLTGEPWLSMLDTLSGSRDFTSGPGRILEYGPYKAVAPDQLQPLRQCLLALARPRKLPRSTVKS